MPIIILTHKKVNFNCRSCKNYFYNGRVKNSSISHNFIFTQSNFGQFTGYVTSLKSLWLWWFFWCITVLHSMIILSYQHDTNFIISSIKSFVFQNNFHILSQDSWHKKSPQETFRIFISTDSIPFLCKKLQNIQYCQSPFILKTLSSPEICGKQCF